MKNVFSEPSMVLSGPGLFEYCRTGAQLLRTISSALTAAQSQLYDALVRDGHREVTAKLVTFPFGSAADACMQASKNLERVWRIARVMIRGMEKPKAARGKGAFDPTGRGGNRGGGSGTS